MLELSQKDYYYPSMKQAMKKIKFSHKYHKMPKDLSAPTILLAVFNADTKELGELFIMRDTHIMDGEEGKDFYDLPKGKVLILLLTTECHMWTTIRRWTPWKETYYRSIIGQGVEIVINPLPSSSPL